MAVDTHCILKSHLSSLYVKTVSSIYSSESFVTIGQVDIDYRASVYVRANIRYAVEKQITIRKYCNAYAPLTNAIVLIKQMHYMLCAVYLILSSVCSKFKCS